MTQQELKTILENIANVVEVIVSDDDSNSVYFVTSGNTDDVDCPISRQVESDLNDLGLEVMWNDCEGYYNEGMICLV